MFVDELKDTYSNDPFHFEIDDMEGDDWGSDDDTVKIPGEEEKNDDLSSSEETW